MIKPIPYIGEPATLLITAIHTAAQIRMRNGFDEESLSELAASIGAVGIIEPLIVRPDPANAGEYILIAGERRLLASSMAGLSEVPAIIRDIDANEAATVQAIENLQREDLTLADTAEGVAKLIAHYKNPSAVAKALGKSPAWVSKRASILKAHADVRAILLEGLTEDAELLLTLSQIRKLPHGAGVAKFESLVSGLRAGTTTRETARAALAKLKNPTAESKAGEDDEEGEGGSGGVKISAKLGLTNNLAQEILHALRFTHENDSPRGSINEAIQQVTAFMTENGWPTGN